MTGLEARGIAGGEPTASANINLVDVDHGGPVRGGRRDDTQRGQRNDGNVLGEHVCGGGIGLQMGIEIMLTQIRKYARRTGTDDVFLEYAVLIGLGWGKRMSSDFSG